jgi:hypothetical protein
MADITNRYFVSPVGLLNQEVYDVCVENPNTIRMNNQETKGIVKLYAGDETDYPFMSAMTEYTHAEMLVELLKPEWQPENEP